MTFPAWLRRVAKFNTVGAIGIVVQLAALAILKSLLGVPYLAATAVAVEIAVLHNFVWHERWTWRDRTTQGGVALRLLKFNLGNGLVSIASNLVLMRLLVGTFHFPLIPSNLAAIGAAALANFLISDRLIFTPGKREPRL